MDLIPLLFQTGYLTVKSYDMFSGVYTLDYPNKEVKKSFGQFLLSTYSETNLSNNRIIINSINDSLCSGDIEKFIRILQSVVKSITYPLIEKKEHYYHSIFYLVVTLLGFDIETEILTCDGRIDAVIMTETYIYVIEFKLGKA
ncbi:MAG: PD-(D/E)XK nuclease domain-containing protein [Bacteroidetes bacterium]|nr:PD-(D/E)XK nuclease domain-containing protein [Bacteroidota bacterium]